MPIVRKRIGLTEEIENMLRSNKIFILIAALYFGVNGLACGGGSPSNGGNSGAGNASNATTNTVAAREKIGVPECDDYLEKYEACLPKLPENEHEEIKGTLALYRMLWKEDAKTPEGKARLVEKCKGTMENSKAMRGNVCGW